jgi:hypothetical protein
MLKEDDDNTNVFYKIGFSLFDIKPLVILHIKSAQDINNPYALYRLRFYEQYHNPLEVWFKQKYNKMPSKADKLTFIILLSYPINFITNAVSFDDFKLFNLKDENNSDFKLIDVINIEFNDNDEFNDEHIDCICSKDNLRYVSRVENKYSHIELYIGSECIRKYKIISQEEINRMNEINEKLKERQKEIKECLPIGYYEEEKKINKIKKYEEKNKKENEKIKKKIESGNYRICYICNITLMNIRFAKDKRICEKCDLCLFKFIHKSHYYKRLHNQINLLCKHYECNNCDKDFIFILSGSEYLCKFCKNFYKTINCNICKINVLIDINSNDIYCSDCDQKIIKCLDCNQTFIKNINNTYRCKICQMCYDNKLKIQKCQECSNNFTRKENESWKKNCNKCYDLNKSKICKNCDQEFDVNINELWKTICVECYKKSKNIFDCSNCGNEFNRLSNETWKKMCYSCYKHFKNLY